ncbi:DNA-methyltransferase [Sphingobium yanoikuyae]|uniref:DNA-methyltransferase n=1 Tax=Sphingobium yanoikuyae TaxID=13690 RepID=UPI0035C80491
MLDVTTLTVVTMDHATLYLADANELLHRLGRVLLVADPPYLFDNSGGGAFRAARGASDQIVAERLDEGFDHSIINPLLHPSVVVFCHNDQLPELLTYLTGNYRRVCVNVWIKPNPSPHRNKHYLADTEFFIHAWQEGHHPVGDHHDMHRHVTARSQPSKVHDHPTVKPDAVMEKIIANMGEGIICDPFMGTGSTGVAAVKAGRTFIGIEHNPKHFATAVERLRLAHEQRPHAPP